jgi:WD40 repeat protein
VKARSLDIPVVLSLSHRLKTVVLNVGEMLYDMFILLVLCSGGRDGCINVWDVRDRKSVCTIQNAHEAETSRPFKKKRVIAPCMGNQFSVTCVRFLQSSSYVASAGASDG